jgi:hypothetical protein
MGGQRARTGSWVVAVLAVLVPVTASALYLDDARTIQLTGRVSTQASWRTTSPKAFTEPAVPAGNLVQSRYLLDVEMYHDVQAWLDTMYHLRTPLDAFGYRWRVKPVYDGVTDYGPHRLRPESNRSDESLQILDHKKLQHNALFWNAYVDLAKGPLSLRIGRQDLSWGETDGFRLVDMIEPLDNRFGFPLVEDLDDRRIPLWMARATLELTFLDRGPFSNTLLEGYFVPGSIDNQISPPMELASPFGINQPRPEVIGAHLQVNDPNKNMSNSRGGGRLVTTLFNRVTVSAVHYYTYNDIPEGKILIVPTGFNLSNFACAPAAIPISIPNFACFANFFLQANYYPLQISGITMTTAVPYDPQSILRVEGAMFWGERVEESSDLSVSTLINLFIASQPPPLGTGQPQTTSHRNSNVMRWNVGIDRPVWIRPLNPANTFYLSAQYFHTHILDANDRQVFPLIDPQKSQLKPQAGGNPLLFLPTISLDKRHQDEIFFTLGGFTFYRNGTIQPFPLMAYDPRGVWALVPGGNYFWGTNWVFTLKYARIMGKWHELGYFKDRDVFLARVQYNLS